MRITLRPTERYLPFEHQRPYPDPKKLPRVDTWDILTNVLHGVEETELILVLGILPVGFDDVDTRRNSGFLREKFVALESEIIRGFVSVIAPECFLIRRRDQTHD